MITASEASTDSDTTVNLDSGGTADSNDIVVPPSSVVLPANATSVTVTVPTRVDNVVKPKQDAHVMALAGGTGYSVGSPDLGADHDHEQQRADRAHQRGDTVSPGGSATLTVTADQAPLHDTQVSSERSSGDAVPGTDYRTVEPGADAQGRARRRRASRSTRSTTT